MRPAAVALAAVVVGSLACSGRGANGRACEAYAEQVNGLECLALTYDAGNLCDPLDAEPGLSGEEPEIDLRPWFDCLSQHVGCRVPVADGRADLLEDCPAPMAPTG